MKKFKVKNLPDNYRSYRFIVIRDCGLENYWFYGCFNDVSVAHNVANDIGNGILVESEQIEKI